MLVAVSTMDPTVQMVFFGISVVLFVLAAFAVTTRIGLLPAGLAFFAFPFFWNALAAS